VIKTFRLLIPVFLVLMQLSVFPVFSGCQSEIDPISPSSPSTPVQDAPASPPEIQGEIIVLSSSTTIDYPDELVFTVELKSPSKISDIRLEYYIDMITTVVLTSQLMADFVPSKVVRANARIETKKTGTMPPGTEIHYHWTAVDSDGRFIETEPATVKFEDSRYSWKSMSEDGITLYWYEGETAFARELIRTARETLDMVATDTGAKLQRDVAIYIYASSKDLREAMVFPVEWTGGVAYVRYGIIAIGISPDQLDWGKRTIAHELMHLVTYQMTYNPYSEIPVWLNEGLSTYAEGDLSAREKTLLKQAIKSDKLASIKSLSSSFPASGEVGLYYAESFSLVEFLIDTYGKEKILQLLNVFKQGKNADDALIEVYGFDTGGLEDAWRIKLGLEPRV
jgi:hypothetical protein